MPAADVLLDSNVLVYGLPAEPVGDEKRKQGIARQLIAETDFGVSYQVLMETYVVATRKLRRPLAPAAAIGFLEPFLEQPVISGSSDLWRTAMRLSLRFDIHPYDAAVVAAAHELGAATLYSEDLSDGQDYDGVRVVNPFKE